MRARRICFADLPRDYTALCRLHLPRPIHDQTEYESMIEIATALAGFEEKMNSDQTDYFDLLTSLLETWESEHVTWNKRSSLELLQHLRDQQGLNGADLSRILGATRLLGPMILRGERTVTAAYARKLGEYFGLRAGVFIE